MTAVIINLADRRAATARPTNPALAVDEWRRPSSDQQAAIRVLLHRTALKLGLPLTAEDYGFLRRYGHLAP